MDIQFSSRVGSLKPRRKFPVFIARPTHGPGFCGHQHSAPEQAFNCAARHGESWSAYRVTADSSEQRLVA